MHVTNNNNNNNKNSLVSCSAPL